MPVVFGRGDLRADRAGDMAQMSASTSWNFFPVFAISDGLVVTPSSSPLAASDLISAVSAVSTKNFMLSLPCAATPYRMQAGVANGSYRMQAPRPTPNPLPQDGVIRRVPVMLPYPFPGPFDYRVPPGMDPQPGDVVLVPLNPREEVGVVWDGQPMGACRTESSSRWPG